MRISDWSSDVCSSDLYIRWVMVKKRDEAAAIAAERVPTFNAVVAAERLRTPPGANFAHYDWALAGSPRGWEDYAPGEKIDHVDGITIAEAQHMLATRLSQNTAREIGRASGRESGGQDG